MQGVVDVQGQNEGDDGSKKKECRHRNSNERDTVAKASSTGRARRTSHSRRQGEVDLEKQCRKKNQEAVNAAR